MSSSIPSGLVASCWPVLPGVWSESNLAEVLILINWGYARIGEQNLAGTAGVCVESGDSTLFGCCNPFHGNVGEGAQNLKNLHRSYLGAELNSFLACQHRKHLKVVRCPTETKRSSNACDPTGVAGRLAARGLFAARLGVHRTQHGQAHSVCWMEEHLPLSPASFGKYVSSIKELLRLEELGESIGMPLPVRGGVP